MRNITSKMQACTVQYNTILQKYDMKSHFELYHNKDNTARFSKTLQDEVRLYGLF